MTDVNRHPPSPDREYPASPLDPGRRTGLILCGMGGPDGPGAVAPFLRNLFADPAIFPVPGPLGRLLGWWIATVRAPRVRRRYLAVSPDGATPQLPATRTQAETLAAYLDERGLACTAGVAMRYWAPWPETTVDELLAAGCEQFLVVPMYPQFSDATGGSTLDFVLAAVRRRAPDAAVHVLAQWPELPAFAADLARSAADRLTAWADEDERTGARGGEPTDTRLVYAAHSLPARLIAAGDPYLDQVRRTVDLVHAHLADLLARDGRPDPRAWCDAEPPRLAFQSRVGPIRWLEPDLTAAVADLARQGCRRLLVVPVSFTCEHIETLLELDVELRDHARARGIATFARVPVPAPRGAWLAGLGDVLLQRTLTVEADAHG